MIKIASLDRSIIKIYGSDACKFLQGLVSNNVLSLDCEIIKFNENISLSPALYSGFFTNNGRYNFDFFIIKHNNYYLIDINSTLVESFLTKLKFYTLISDVKLEVINDLKVFAIFNYNKNTDFKNFNLNNNSTIDFNHLFFVDSRLPSLGLRYISFALDESLSSFVCPSIDYDYLCHQLGVVDCAFTVEKSIPLEYGFDELNAISYNKGCYLGQEFTNSSKNRLAIRKRVVPIVINSSNINLHDNILAKKGDNFEKAGKIISICKDYALVLFKMKFKDYPLFYNDKLVTIKLPDWVKTFSID